MYQIVRTSEFSGRTDSAVLNETRSQDKALSCFFEAVNGFLKEYARYMDIPFGHVIMNSNPEDYEYNYKITDNVFLFESHNLFDGELGYVKIATITV